MKHRSRWSALAAGSLSLAMAGFGLVAASTGAGAATHVRHAAKTTKYYISLGDSYSEGYQNPTLTGSGGYTDTIAKKEKMTLVNFGCGGATTKSLLDTMGCPGTQEPTYGMSYDSTTQEEAALNFIAANPGKVGLISISIGGNDVTACAGNSDPVGCVVAASTTISTNVGTLISDLDTALAANGDSSAKIVGITYPDVILGNYTIPAGSTDPSLAYLSTVAFDDIINPTLKSLYDSAQNGSFVDVTDAPYIHGKINAPTGDDSNTWDSSTSTFTGTTVKLNPWGVIPENVAEVCDLTWYCTSSYTFDIHPNTNGYKFITGLIESDLGI